MSESEFTTASQHSRNDPSRVAASRRWRGIAEVAAAGFCFGFLGIFGKLAFKSGFEIGELLAFRFTIAALILGASLALFSPSRLRISRAELGVCAGLGILGYALFASLYFKAIEGVSVALASLLLYTYPVLVALGARVFFGERLTRLQLIALPLALIGLLFLVSQGGSLAPTEARNPWAVAAGLASALCYALYILASSHLQRRIDPLTSGLYVIAFAAIGLFVAYRPDYGRLLELDAHQAGVIFGIALVCTVAPLVLFLSGLQKLGNTEASLLGTFEPLTAAVFGWLLLGERLGRAELMGGALVLLALVITALGSRHES